MAQLTVNAKTNLYAILGDPIRHSMSPVIMNRSFQRSGLDNVFVAMPCKIDELDCVMRALRVIDLRGYVFTMPLKERAAGYMDELRDEAAVTGAVNCVRNDHGRLIGYNTDSSGFWTAIQEKNAAKRPIQKLFLMGMGGFAKAAVAQAALQGVPEIVVANPMGDEQFVQSFRTFLERLREKAPQTQVRLLPWEVDCWRAELAGADVVANATPNGMNGVGDLHERFPFACVDAGAIFFDAIYSPLKTAFLKIAEQRGHAVVAGLDLLAHQGACSFQIWTGTPVDPALMRQDALEFLSAQGAK